jgi:hypothetical protein
VFAEFERAMIAERVRGGMARAKAAGKHCGRSRIDNKTEACCAGSPALRQGHLQHCSRRRRWCRHCAADEGRDARLKMARSSEREEDMCKRETDDQIFKHVGVGGVGKPRIVQIRVDAGSLCK